MTLVELTIVLLILAILSALLIPSGANAAPEVLKVAADIVKTDLALARSLAVTEGRNYRVVFSPDGDSYQITPSSKEASAAPLTSPFSDRRGELFFRLSSIPQVGGRARVVDIVGSGLADKWAFEFDRWGGLAGGGQVQVVLCTVGSLETWEIVIVVDPVTGRCQVGTPTRVGF